MVKEAKSSKGGKVGGKKTRGGKETQGGTYIMEAKGCKGGKG